MQIIAFITDITARNLMACNAQEAMPDDLTISFHLNLCASVNKRNGFWYYREILPTRKEWTGAFGIQRGVEGASNNRNLVTLLVLSSNVITL